MIAVWMAIGFIVTLNLSPVTPARMVLPLALQASLAAALILVRLGHFQLASLVYPAGSWAWAAVVMYISGGIRTPALIVYGANPSRPPGSSERIAEIRAHLESLVDNERLNS
jgi:hypothetical protein